MLAIEEFLTPYRLQIEEEIMSHFSSSWPSAERLREACRYALNSGGKRFRPAIVYMLAEALGNAFLPREAALAVEFFHTASLIADDLPCMDDDDLRRGIPTLHKAFDEATALLASYALIAEGYSSLARGAQRLHNSKTTYAHNASEIALLAVENISFNTGPYGATGGQYLDLFPEKSGSSLEEILAKKTASLFEIAFVCGWLFGGGDLLKLTEVKKCAHCFGMAFQIADDLLDREADNEAHREANIAVSRGTLHARQALIAEVNDFEERLKQLKISSQPLSALASTLTCC